MGHTFAGILLALASVVCLASAQSSFYDRYCTETGKTSYFAPYYPDSSKFVWCMSGTAQVLSCNPNTVFDCTYRACLAPEKAKPCVPVITVVPSYINEMCRTMPVGTQIPSIACDKYYVCRSNVSGSAVELSCPQGQHYSRAYSACMSPLKAGCRALGTMCKDEFSGYQFASLQCDKYYTCNDALVPVESSCSAGLYYNMILQTCTSPAQSGCVPDVTQPPITTTWTPTSMTTTTPNDCGLPNCDSNNNGAFFAHPKCNWFYMCFNSTALEMQCECGQYYNAALKYCVQDTNNVCKAS